MGESFHFSIAEANEANNISMAADPQPVVWQFGNVGSRQDVQLKLTYAEGDNERNQTPDF
ncbi:hypothetical protein IQ241_17690 [Romeria aff. gracilis LEGE 07310]|uniref:Uncharacterized protein n=1 Tax=Vasconcelosia minhoensis LEGE 07310 TaxID=915328 RepID=A0A8J7AK34_9CYAN|nr:hypothetical protein [Romeria gracilis]MBE9079108.1 hypothetical protein [Romeria aff. gracilis LEGE 07310]